MYLESGDQETRRTIATERWPKSVICRIVPPWTDMAQRLVVPRSRRGAANQLPSGDSVCCHTHPSNGRRDLGIRASNSDGPFSGLAFQISMPPNSFCTSSRVLSRQERGIQPQGYFDSEPARPGRHQPAFSRYNPPSGSTTTFHPGTNWLLSRPVLAAANCCQRDEEGAKPIS